MVFQKQLNEEGNYIGQDGFRYEILHCERTESMEYVQTGTETQIIDEETVEVPIIEKRIVINKSWDSFEDEKMAALAYGLEYSPKEEPTK